MSLLTKLSLLALIVTIAVSGTVSAKSIRHHKKPIAATAPKPIVYTAAALADQITNLPGLPTQPTFNQFAGYLEVNVNKSIFYWYTESQNAPATDPVVWWSNGGPGCSGLIGFLTEHGPFRPSQAGDGNLEYYPYAWNRIANTLYVEAPVGVGFSFSTYAPDYNANDNQTAHDNFAAIQSFFTKFPHLASNDFFLAAESYGGHYVPTLTKVIIDDGSLQSTFKGFLVGNPLTDPVEFANGPPATLCGRALSSNPTCTTFQTACGANNSSQACTDAQNAVMSECGSLDAYGLDFPTCPSSSKTQEKRHMLRHIYRHRMHHKGFPKNLKKQLSVIPDPYDPCTQNEETTYLNRQDVIAAIHANTVNGAWVACGEKVNYDDEFSTYMEPVYSYILEKAPQLRMIVFSGDDDDVVPTLGTESWIWPLFGGSVVQPWGQWTYTSDEYGSQIGGSYVKFNGISFVTVHGAGHMVSGYQPEKGFALFQQYLAGSFNTQ